MLNHVNYGALEVLVGRFVNSEDLTWQVRVSLLENITGMGCPHSLSLSFSLSLSNTHPQTVPNCSQDKHLGEVS